MTTRAGGDPRSLILFAQAGHDWIRGSEQCLLDLLAGLDRARFRALVLCNAPTVARAVEETGTDAVRVRRWPRSAVGALSLRGPVLEIARRHGAALVHANMARVLPTMHPVAHHLGIPVVAHLHMPYLSFPEYHRYLIRGAAAIVGVAENVVAPLRETAVPPARIHVVHNAVNARRLEGGDARALRAALGIPPSALVATSIGSLIARKGHGVTVRAVARARANGLDLHLLLCGGGEEEAALRRLAEELDVGERVHLLGFRPDPGAILRDATDVLVSSAVDEALPLNVIEAQWLGVPVVASDIPGHRDALAPAAGVLVPKESPEALAAALAALAHDPQRARAMGEAGRAHAHAHYRMERYVGAFEALYETLLTHPGAGAGRADRPWPPTLGPWLRAERDRRLHRLRGRWSSARRAADPRAERGADGSPPAPGSAAAP